MPRSKSKSKDQSKWKDDNQFTFFLNLDHESEGFKRGMKMIWEIIAKDIVREYLEKQAEVLRRLEEPQLEFPWMLEKSGNKFSNQERRTNP